MTAPSTNVIKLIAEVLDQGTGSRVKNDVEIDSSLAGFELIPLRPGYYRHSSNISILVSDLQINNTNIVTTFIQTDIYLIDWSYSFYSHSVLSESRKS